MDIFFSPLGMVRGHCSPMCQLVNAARFAQSKGRASRSFFSEAGFMYMLAVGGSSGQNPSFGTAEIFMVGARWILQYCMGQPLKPAEVSGLTCPRVRVLAVAARVVCTYAVMTLVCFGGPGAAAGQLRDTVKCKADCIGGTHVDFR